MSDRNEELRAVVREAVRDEMRPFEKRLDAHETRLTNQADQLAVHNTMLMRHAELLTQHAEKIIAAQENARTARQSSSDVAKESKAALEAIDRHLKATDKHNAEKLDKIVLAGTQAAEQRALHAAALNRLVTLAPSKTTIAVSFAIGSAVMGAVGALLHWLFGGH